MHIGYALVIGASLLRYGRRRTVRFVGVLYAPFALLVVVATGNHFLFDALAGAVVTGVAAAAALLLVRPPSADARLSRLSEQPAPARSPEKLAT